MAKKVKSYFHYCDNCGAKMASDKDVCPSCNLPYNVEKRYAGIPKLGAGGIGWSDKVNAPCFKKKRKKGCFWFIKWLLILFVAIGVVMLITGELKPDIGGLMLWLLICAAVGAIDMAWYIVCNIRYRDWEGTVTKKDIQTERSKWTDKESGQWGYHETTWYTVVLSCTDGKERKIARMTRIWFDYLEVGDQIRYHGKNMSFYEKYDKTKDEFIPCAGCGYDEDSRASYCGKCGCVLLKGTMQNL